MTVVKMIVWGSFFALASLMAQPNPALLGVILEHFPSADPEEALAASPNLETRLSNFKGHIAYPLLNEDEQKLIVRLSYQQLRFRYNDNELNYSPDRLRELALQLALVTALSEEWQLSAFATPNLASDFEDVGTDHLNLNGGILLARRLGRVAGYAVGALYLNDFGEPFVLPALRYWRKRRGYRIDLFLPRYAELMLLIQGKAELGLTARVTGNHYRIGEDAPLLDDRSTKEGRIKYSAISVGPGFNLGLSNNFYFTLEGGIALRRKFTLFDSEDQELINLDLKEGFILRGGLQLRP